VADNVAVTPGSGATIAADELTDGTLGSVKVQYIKIMDGTLDSSVKTTVKAASTAAAATDPALVVSVSPNSPMTINPTQLGTLGQTTMSASVPIAIASDQTYGNSTGSAVPAKAMYGGANAITALPTAATAGNLEGISADKFGRQIVLPVTVRDLVGTQAVTLSATTTETTIITAGGAGIFNDLMCLVISNTSASTNTRVDIRDATAGTIIASIQSVGGAPPVGIPYMGTPIPQTTAANNWTAQCATSTTDVRVFAVYAKNK
jgi:hypothetical protein